MLALECPLATASTGPVTPAKQVRLLNAADAEDFVVFRQGPDADLFLNRIGRDRVCYAAICDGRIASVSWVALERATLWRLNGDFDLGGDEIYVYDSYTHPDFRGRRLQASIFEAIRDDFAANGYRRALTFVVPENIANLRSRARVGFSACGMIRRFTAGPFTLFRPAGRCPPFTLHRRG